MIRQSSGMTKSKIRHGIGSLAGTNLTNGKPETANRDDT